MTHQQRITEKTFPELSIRERVELRKQQRLNKRLGKTDVRTGRTVLPPNPIEDAITTVGLEDFVDRQGRTVVPNAAGFDVTIQGEDFEAQFLELIPFLPDDQQKQAFSFFSVFRQQPLDQQKRLLDSIMEFTKKTVSPIFNLQRTRLREDTDFAVRGKQRGIDFANAQFDLLKGTVDVNALRDKAKEDKELGKIIRRISSRAFITNVAGSGIIKRRTAEARDVQQEAREDIELAASQKIAVGELNLGQSIVNAEAAIARAQQLRERGEFDLAQQELEEQRLLFVDLFERQLAPLGEFARRNIGLTGEDLGVAGGGVEGVAGFTGADLAAGITPAGEEAPVPTAVEEPFNIRNVSVQDLKSNINRLIQLEALKKSLRSVGRKTVDFGLINTEINRLKKFGAEGIRRARNRLPGGFLGSQGPIRLNDEIRRRSDLIAFGGARGGGPAVRQGAVKFLRKSENLIQSLQAGEQPVTPTPIGAERPITTRVPTPAPGRIAQTTAGQALQERVAGRRQVRLERQAPSITAPRTVTQPPPRVTTTTTRARPAPSTRRDRTTGRTTATTRRFTRGTTAGRRVSGARGRPTGTRPTRRRR